MADLLPQIQKLILCTMVTVFVSYLEKWRIMSYIQIRKFYERKILIIFLPINLNMCCVYSKEPSH